MRSYSSYAVSWSRRSLDQRGCHEPTSHGRHDLLSHSKPAPTLVHLNRTVDRLRPCCENLAVVGPGQGPHPAELKCAGCDAHRGWLSRQALNFLKTTVARASSDPIPLRDSTIGDFKMKDFDNTNRGAIFRNDQKEKDT